MSAKNQADFSDLSEVDAVRLVANTAIVARDSGHPVRVNVARLRGAVGIMVWMPGYTLSSSGEIVANQQEAVVANDGDLVVARGTTQ